ncbi:MAG: integrase arm-type DNA-binding domain-containing protein [Gammaproteobacteria bacterium]|nr:integrase arm-type DNA-binding domain-containing protein [Gammaproteobacteria bacterium]MBQ0840541.1 integrase arm-type DNA-binding domain-containing protein [Gammaproteobacteria bacterium]
MPRKAKELSAIEVARLSKRGVNPVGGVAGLMLSVSLTGARSWILRATIGTRVNGKGEVVPKRRDIGLGGYPDVPLKDAREKARKKRAMIEDGIDPVLEKQKRRQELIKAQQATLSFADAAKRCHAVKAQEFRNHKHSRQWLATLERYAFPVIGQLPVADIDTTAVLSALEPIWKEKTETASRVRQRIAAVFDFALAGGYRSKANPANWRGCLEPLLPKPERLKKKAGIKHHAAIPVNDLPRFMGDLRCRKGMGAKALEFAILTAARSGEVRGATWGDIDLKGRLWIVPASKMKKEKAHTVPLSNQAIELLESLPRDGDLVFSGKNDAKLSDMTLSKSLKSIHNACVAAGGAGYIDPLQNRVATPHGTARSTFKDWSRKDARFPDEWSELALAHVNSDETRAAYARDQLVSERAGMMQSWADFADGAEVVAFPGSAETMK